MPIWCDKIMSLLQFSFKIRSWFANGNYTQSHKETDSFSLYIFCEWQAHDKANTYKTHCKICVSRKCKSGMAWVWKFNGEFIWFVNKKPSSTLPGYSRESFAWSIEQECREFSYFSILLSLRESAMWWNLQMGYRKTRHCSQLLCCCLIKGCERKNFANKISNSLSQHSLAKITKRGNKKSQTFSTSTA